MALIHTFLGRFRAQHVNHGDHHAGNQGTQNGLLVHTGLTLQHGDHTGGGAAPGQQVHDGVHQDHQNTQVHHFQVQLFIDGNKRGAADQGRGGAVAVQGDTGGHNGGAQQHLHGIALGEADHGPGDGVKQTGVEHDGEVQNSEQQHNAGVGGLLYTGHRPVADDQNLIPQGHAGGIHSIGGGNQLGVLAQEGTQQGKYQRYQQQGRERLHFFGHDQCQEDNDHCPCDDCHGHWDSSS